VFNVLPLNSLTHYVRATYLSILVFTFSGSLHSSITHLCPRKRRLEVGGHALMSGSPQHWTIQPWTWIRTKVHRMITMHTRHRQTGIRTNIMAIARRFVVRNDPWGMPPLRVSRSDTKCDNLTRCCRWLRKEHNQRTITEEMPRSDMGQCEKETTCQRLTRILWQSLGEVI